MLKIKPRTWAAFILQGNDLNPDEVSELLGVKPDFSIHKKLHNLQSQESRPHWQLNSSLSPEASIEEHFYNILKKLAPSRSKLKELTAKLEAVFYASVEFSSMEVDGIRLEPRLLLLLGDLGIHLEILPWLEESGG
jgi:hypothetical protein